MLVSVSETGRVSWASPGYLIRPPGGLRLAPCWSAAAAVLSCRRSHPASAITGTRNIATFEPDNVVETGDLPGSEPFMAASPGVT